MLLLKGDVGKSVIVEQILKADPRNIGFYAENIGLYVGNAYLFVSDNPKEFADSLSEFIESLKCKLTPVLVVYTNWTEDNIKPIIDIVEKIEGSDHCAFAVITCRNTKVE